jgi:hypothetical protein
MSKRTKIDLEKPIVETTEVNSNEEIQEKTLLADDSATSSEVSEEQKTETDVEVGTEETVTVVEPVTTEEKPTSKEKYNKNIDFAGRGFSSFEEAIKFPETSYFKGLGKEDQEEYLNWLKK